MNKLLLAIGLLLVSAFSVRADTTNITVSVVVTITDIKGNPLSSDQSDLVLSPTAVNGFLVVMGKDEMLAQQLTNKPPAFIDSVAGEVKASVVPHIEAIALADEAKRTKVAMLPDAFPKMTDADKKVIADILAKYAP